jgi:hypothetical protein
MKHAVSFAMVLLLLGMPLGCILTPCAIAHPCCPKTDANLKCPYDTFDSAKVASLVVTVSLPAGQAQIEPEITFAATSFTPSIEKDESNLHILNRILRI